MRSPLRGPLHGLYAITSDTLCRAPGQLARAVEAALAGGARLIQYRDKESDAAARQHTARALLELCRTHNALFIVNDDVELALAIGADGVHLGNKDLPLREARRRLGGLATIGVSCANALERAITAQGEGASYVAFGRFFPSRTKPEAPQAELALLRQAREKLHIPICAIGGITPANARPLVEAGAAMIAAVEGVFGAGPPEGVEAAARAYSRLFDN
ncbi:MAG: thiamine phosphate synthase [Gammaproteobacteria bacterium]